MSTKYSTGSTEDGELIDSPFVYGLPSDLIAVLDSFLSLQKGWDSYGGVPIHPKAIAKAKELLSLLPDWQWQAVPCSDGSVQLEMHNSGYHIEILIDDVEYRE